MIIFLYGEDNFSSRRKLKEIINRYQSLHPRGLNLQIFDFQPGKNSQKVNFEDFQNQLQTKSIFTSKKFFILKNVFLNPQVKTKFFKKREILLISKDIILFFENQNPSPKDSFFIFLKKKAKSQKFEPLKREKLENWIEQEFSQAQTKIEPQAKDLLIELVGNNLWQLANEVEKLANYKRKTKTVGLEDVKILVSSNIETNIFKTIDFIASKEKERALFLLHQHLEKGDSPLYLLSMIVFQFRNLLLIKEKINEGKSIWKLKWHPFLIKKTFRLSQKFTLTELKKIYQKIFQIDLGIKTGRITPELALDLFIARI